MLTFHLKRRQLHDFMTHRKSRLLLLQLQYGKHCVNWKTNAKQRKRKQNKRNSSKRMEGRRRCQSSNQVHHCLGCTNSEAQGGTIDWKMTEASPFNSSSRRSRVGGYCQNWPGWEKCLLGVAAMWRADCWVTVRASMLLEWCGHQEAHLSMSTLEPKPSLQHLLIHF